MKKKNHYTLILLFIKDNYISNIIMRNIPVSNGEIIDKFTILLIKQELIKDEDKLKKVNHEIDQLKEHVNEIKKNNMIEFDIKKLFEINKELWEIEDNIRIKEKNKEFDAPFIELARAVYVTNDQRAFMKNEINKKTNSTIFEVKSYEKYD